MQNLWGFSGIITGKESLCLPTVVPRSMHQLLGMLTAGENSRLCIWQLFEVFSAGIKVTNQLSRLQNCIGDESDSMHYTICSTVHSVQLSYCTLYRSTLLLKIKGNINEIRCIFCVIKQIGVETTLNSQSSPEMANYLHVSSWIHWSWAYMTLLFGRDAILITTQEWLAIITLILILRNESSLPINNSLSLSCALPSFLGA